MTTTPTQVRRPWRTTVRSAFQVAIPTIIVLGIVVPEAVQIILDETGTAMPEQLRGLLLAASAVIVAAAAILTRIMAIPQVEKFLRDRRFLDNFAAEPDRPDVDFVRGERGAGELRLALIIIGAIVAAWLLIVGLPRLL